MLPTVIGSIGEKEFELSCLRKEIPVSKPIVDLNGYDYIIQKKNKLLKIQVKSTSRAISEKSDYKINVTHTVNSTRYVKGSYDYLAIYIFELNLWYIIPFIACAGKSSVRIRPLSIKSQYTRYKEAWNLLQ